MSAAGWAGGGGAASVPAAAEAFAALLAPADRWRAAAAAAAPLAVCLPSQAVRDYGCGTGNYGFVLQVDLTPNTSWWFVINPADPEDPPVDMRVNAAITGL